MSLLETAIQYLSAGLNVLPIKTDGSKKPSVDEWKSLQSRKATEAEIKQWFSNGSNGIAIIAGSISHGLEIIDLESKEIAKQWQELVAEQLGDEFFQRFAVVKTPMGYHCYYRCDQAGPNQDLALRPPTAEELVSNPKRKYYKLIETRGEGGYVLAPGCPAACHKTGLTYQLTSKDFDQIEMITMEERQVLLECARSLNEYFPEHVAYVPQRYQPGWKEGDERPGDLFNQKADWSEAFPLGWEQNQRYPKRWKRPGSKNDSLFITRDQHTAFVVTSSVPPLEEGRAYTKFSIYALLHFGAYGFADASAQLAKDPRFKPAAPATKPNKQEVHEPTQEPQEQPTFSAISAVDLINTNFQPPNWAIEDLLPEGLTILAGSPKIGKSWLALDIGVSVTSGASVLGGYQTFQGEVLYLSLEDSYRRLKTRLLTITDEPAYTLHFQNAIPPMDQGGLLLLKTWLKEHPACKLVIIDTLARFMPTADKGVNAYQADYHTVAKLQKLAMEHGIALLAIHHVRKNKTGDVFDGVSGSSGIIGPADAVWVLQRPRTESRGTLTVTGRDVEEMELSAEFDKESNRWSILGDARQEARKSTLVALSQRFGKESFTYLQAKDALGVSLTKTKSVVGGLVEIGYAVRLQEVVETGKRGQKPLLFSLTSKFAQVTFKGEAHEPGF